MTHTPTPAEIETLREAVDGCGGPSYTQAIAILDRLSPAPEVDDVTVFATRTYWHLKNSRFDNENIEYLRQAIAELIASKDAEIAKLTGERDRQYDDNVNRIAAEGAAIVRAEKAESELAALRAENERLKGEDRVSSDDLYEWYKEGMHIRESNGINPYMAGSLAYYQSLHGWLSRDLQIALAKACPSYTLTPLPKLKAAERNTAEPERRLSSERAIPAGEVVRSPSSRSSDGSGNPAKPTTETTPEVDAPVDSGMGAEAVEQAELLWAQLPVNRKWTSIPTHEKALVCHLLSAYRTEAEARGRREALEAATARLEWYRQYGAGMIDQRGFAASLIAELKRLMTEPKP